jgi:ATP:corrinoid adenosyltransferase
MSVFVLHIWIAPALDFLIEAADTVSEMHSFKHGFESGRGAQKVAGFHKR